MVHYFGFLKTLDVEAVQEAKEEQEKEAKLKSLFAGCKLFLSREVPREALTFVLRYDKMDLRDCVNITNNNHIFI